MALTAFLSQVSSTAYPSLSSFLPFLTDRSFLVNMAARTGYNMNSSGEHYTLHQPILLAYVCYPGNKLSSGLCRKLESSPTTHARITLPHHLRYVLVAWNVLLCSMVLLQDDIFVSHFLTASVRPLLRPSPAGMALYSAWYARDGV